MENPIKMDDLGVPPFQETNKFSQTQLKAQSVLVAFGLTAFIVTALMLFACQTKYDFTGIAA